MQDCESVLRRSKENILKDIRVSFFIVRLISFNDENNGASLIVGLIIRARAKRNKDALNGLIH